MRFLIIGEYEMPFIPPSIEGIGAIGDKALIPHLEAVARAEEDGVILTGGVYPGGYKCAYIGEAESREDLVEALQGLPERIFARMDVIPLESTGHRLTRMRERVEDWFNEVDRPAF